MTFLQKPVNSHSDQPNKSFWWLFFILKYLMFEGNRTWRALTTVLLGGLHFQETKFSPSVQILVENEGLSKNALRNKVGKKVNNIKHNTWEVDSVIFPMYPDFVLKILFEYLFRSGLEPEIFRTLENNNIINLYYTGGVGYNTGNMVDYNTGNMVDYNTSHS